MNPISHPKLRWPLSINIEEFENQKVLLFTCPLGVSTPLGLNPAVAPLVSYFDGTLSVEQLANKFADQGATPELVQQITDLLDQNYYLDSPRFHANFDSIKREFREMPTRLASRAGYVYEANAQALEKQIDEYLVLGGDITPSLRGGMMGLVAPHIDYRRGGHSYGKAYHQMRDEQHDLHILIGTSHQYSEGIFHLTKKHFLCPLKDAQCDVRFVEQLAKQYGDRSFADELLHKDEHSLELQIPFLMRVSENARIAPILVGSFFHMIDAGKYPEEFPEYDDFAAALAETITTAEKSGERICFLAGVDMAHVGQSFGDKAPLTPEYMEIVEKRDQLYLDGIAQQNKHALFDHIAEDRDARRICGFPTMYTVIDVCDRLGVKYSAELFDYSQAVDYDTECAVTFAGLGLYLAPEV
jgi:AmmeMemoRadiSam system protein B